MGEDTKPRLILDATPLTKAASPGDLLPYQDIAYSVSHPRGDLAYVRVSSTTDGIDFVNYPLPSMPRGTLTVYFKSPAKIQNGRYEDTITVHAYSDEALTDEVEGSPITIDTTYTVSDGVAGTLSRSSVSFEIDSREEHGRDEHVQLMLDQAPESGLFLFISNTSDALSWILDSITSPTERDFQLSFRSPRDLATGEHQDTVTIKACFDGDCIRQVQGSPFTISTAMTVKILDEPGYSPLEVASRIALGHDVVDAEFSKPLNKVVMVGSYPTNALYVYDVATGQEAEQPLAQRPLAVSVSPNGLVAAVGHESTISIVDVANVGQVGAPNPIVLDVSDSADELVLDGNGFVHVFPYFSDTWISPHSVEIGTNTERAGVSQSLYPTSLARLQPFRNAIYQVEGGSIPTTMYKWDISGGIDTFLYWSPPFGAIGGCGGLWFSEDGETIYTPCGEILKTSTTPSEDMVVTGSIALSPPTPATQGAFSVVSLSQTDAQSEIALIESDGGDCRAENTLGPCYMHLATYDSALLARQSVAALGPINVGATDYAQAGKFVFHSASGNEIVLISKLERIADPAAEYYLSVVQ